MSRFVVGVALFLVAGCSSLDVHRARPLGRGRHQLAIAAQGGGTAGWDCYGYTYLQTAGGAAAGTIRYGLEEKLDVGGGVELVGVPGGSMFRGELAAKWVLIMNERFATGITAGIGAAKTPPPAVLPYAKIG